MVDRSRDWGHVNPRHPDFPRPSQIAPKQSNDGTAPEVATRDPTPAWGYFLGKLFSHVFTFNVDINSTCILACAARQMLPIVELIYRGYIQKVSELVDKLTCPHKYRISFHIRPQLPI